MNLILLDDSEFETSERVRLSFPHARHVRDVLKAQLGDRLRVGQIDGLVGWGEVQEITTSDVFLKVNLENNPPPPLPVTLVLALPRPKVFRRLLHGIVSFGVKDIYFINSYRVEKSYWQSDYLREIKVLEICRLGLEQARDTKLPRVHFRNLFKPFVEDELPAIIDNVQAAYVAHPSAPKFLPQEADGRVALAVGPEGGFIDYEIEKLTVAGFQPVQLGERILRVETAVPALLSRWL